MLTLAWGRQHHSCYIESTLLSWGNHSLYQMNGSRKANNPLCLPQTRTSLIVHDRLFIAWTAAEELKRHRDLLFHKAPLLTFIEASATFHREGEVCAKTMSLFFSLSGVKRLHTTHQRLSLDIRYQTVDVLSTHTMHLLHWYKKYCAAQYEVCSLDHCKHVVGSNLSGSWVLSS